MSRLCRLKSYKSIGEDGQWAYDEITTLRQRVAELEKERDTFKETITAQSNTNHRLRTERDKATQYWQIAEGRCDALQERIDSLLTTGNAVVERWDSPLWKDLPHTGEFIHALREALWRLYDAVTDHLGGCAICGDDDEFRPNVEAFEETGQIMSQD